MRASRYRPGATVYHIDGRRGTLVRRVRPLFQWVVQLDNGDREEWWEKDFGTR
jgi:hypothetical protein